MIGKVIKGWDAKRLVKYLLSPGEHNEHREPHVIAAWDGDPGGLDPRRVGPGDFDYDPDDVAHLLEHINAAAAAVGLPNRQPPKGTPGHTKHGYVWHCPISIEAEHGTLSPQQWEQIARDVMDRTGIAPEDDPGGCRWIAVHHGPSVDGNDHIHIAAVLVRQDTGKRVYPRDDYKKLGQVMSEWERKLGLRELQRGEVAGAASHPSRGEEEKASRRAEKGDAGLGRGRAGASAREQLRQVVIETAAAAEGEEKFLASLREQGVLVHLRRNDAGKVTGYSVAAPGDVSAKTGRPIFFGGGTLGPELTWGKLHRWWSSGPVGEEPAAATPREEVHETIGQSTRAARSAADAVRGRTEPVEPIARSLRDLMATWSKAADGTSRHADLTHGAWQYERSARAGGATETACGNAAQELRRASRRMARLGMLSERGTERPALAELALAVGALLMELAAYFEQHQRLAHHSHTLATAEKVRAYGAAVGSPADTRSTSTAPRERGNTNNTRSTTVQRRHPNHRPWDPPRPDTPGHRPRPT